jgi:uncharacterized protein (UPF0276 family)
MTAMDRPAVGLLYNPATPLLIARAPALIEYLAVMPDRLWYDFGPGGGGGRRFHRTLGAIDELRRCAEGRTIAGHGIGLSLPSAIPLDLEFVDAVSDIARELGFAWFSEHLSVFITPRGSVPNAQAGLGLPVAYDDETYAIVASKAGQLRNALGCPIALETGAFFTPLTDLDMSEAQFLNRLHAAGRCETLLDLHNIHVNERNGGQKADDYIAELNPEAVVEIHLGGGDDFAGFYMDSHSSLTPPEVWRLAFDHAGRFPNLRAITFEFQETYYQDLEAGLVAEIERMHELAEASAREPVRLARAG